MADLSRSKANLIAENALLRQPRFVLRDNDSKYGSAFDIVAKATGIEALRAPYRAPLANAIPSRC